MKIFEVPAPFGDDEKVLKKYPHIKEHGSLANLLRAVLGGDAGQVQISGFDESIKNGSKLWASIEKGNRRSDIYAVSAGHYYGLSVSENGISLVSYTTSSLEDLKRFIDLTFVQHKNTSQIAKALPKVVIADEAKYYEAGPEQYLAYIWSGLLDWLPKEWPHMKSVVEEASRRKELRMLCPYSSHGTLCFSLEGLTPAFDKRITVFPLPPYAEGMFEVEHSTKGKLGIGNAMDAINLVVQNIK